MDNTAAKKGIISAILFVFGFIYNAIGVFFIILLVAMALDYITGILAAWKKGELYSQTGIVGIVRKIGYMGLVLVALLLDLGILQAAAQFGIQIPLDSMFGLLTMAWLFANEGISIMENLAEIGVPIPGFLKHGLKTFKDTIEKKNEGIEHDEKNND